MLFFFLGMPKMNLNKGLFGVRKSKFQRLDDINLLCEINILSSCEMSGLCRPCKKHLTWCLEIVMLRWDYIKYIDFYSALEVVKNNRRLFNDSLKFLFD